jgi:hypothetical protein
MSVNPIALVTITAVGIVSAVVLLKPTPQEPLICIPAVINAKLKPGDSIEFTAGNPLLPDGTPAPKSRVECSLGQSGAADTYDRPGTTPVPASSESDRPILAAPDLFWPEEYLGGSVEFIPPAPNFDNFVGSVVGLPEPSALGLFLTGVAVWRFLRK